MTWALLLFTAVVVLALFALRPFVRLRRTERQLAMPLAVIERACADAVEELCRAAADERSLWVSPFPSSTTPIAAVKPASIAALGDDAREEHRQLVQAMQRWNAAAYDARPVQGLLPTILVAHEAAQRLARRIEGSALQLARRTAAGRVLMSLVTEPPAEDAVVH